MTRLGVLGLIAVAALFLAACSEDGSGVSDAVDNAGDAVGDAVEGATDSGDGGDSGGGDNGDSGSSGGDSGGESEKLPGWAIALLVAVAVLAVVGVIVGFQNRGARKTGEATQQAYDQGRHDAGSSGQS